MSEELVIETAEGKRTVDDCKKIDVDQQSCRFSGAMRGGKEREKQG